MHVHLRIRTHARVRMHFRMHACMHLPTYCSTIAFDILSYTPPHIGEGLIYMAKTKAKQPNKQTADASQPTGRQPLAEQPVGARRRVFWIGIACALAGAGKHLTIRNWQCQHITKINLITVYPFTYKRVNRYEKSVGVILKLRLHQYLITLV